MFALYPPDEEKRPLAVWMRKTLMGKSPELRLEASVEPGDEMDEDDELLKESVIGEKLADVIRKAEDSGMVFGCDLNYLGTKTFLTPPAIVRMLTPLSAHGDERARLVCHTSQNIMQVSDCVILR